MTALGGLIEDVRDPMNRAEERPSGLSPIKAFAMVGGLVVIAAIAVILLTRPSGPPVASTTPKSSEPDLSLTDAEAIDRFNQLNDLALRAFSEADPSLVGLFAAPNSPIDVRSRQAIRKLKREGVRDMSNHDSLRLRVSSNELSRIKLLETSNFFPCFIDEQGGDVTEGPRAVKRAVQWTLVEYTGEWLLFDSRLIYDREIRERDDCP